jgi:cytidylate kinase
MRVIESAGGPRSGKGTITKHLGQSYPGAATDETGLDYRAITLGLLHAGALEEDMDAETVAKIVNTIDSGEITDLAARRYELVASLGEKTLYGSNVSALVGKVSPHDHVRHAIKAGFQRRVELQRDSGTHLLIVDGRNLAPILRSLQGVEIVLRLFVDCEVPVAVKREAKRSKIDLGDPSSNEWYLEQFRKIMERRTEDEMRSNDPALPDKNAINYWYNTSVRVATAERYAQRNGLAICQAMNILTEPEYMRIDGRISAGTLARQSDRQVYFDTTEIGEDPMKDYAKRMADEALDTPLLR